MSAYYLAIDQGGHASRAIVFDAAGNPVSQAEQSIQTHTPRVGWVEHDAAALVQATRAAIHRALAPLGDNKRHIQAAGLATQRASIACWHKTSGAALAPILSWQDRRHAQWLERLHAHSETIHAKTGLFLSPHYGASKMRWCLDNLDEVKHARQQGQLVIGPLASFLAWQLVKQRPLLADPANASRTLLWNLQRGDWDDDLLELFGIPKAILPPCVASRAAVGQLDIDALSIPLEVITGDQSAALFAWGRPQAEACYINVGTGAFVQRAMNTLPNAKRLLSGIAYQDDSQTWFTLEGTVNGAARALQWYGEKHGITNIEQCVTEALASAAIPALFINTVVGLGSPDWHSQLEPRFVGSHNRAAQLLGIVESIVFLIQRNLDEMRHCTAAAQHIIISGGLAKLDRLCQSLADLSKRPVKRPPLHEATASGLAYLVAQPSGKWCAGEGSRTFLPHTHAALEQRYSDWSRELQRSIADKA
ncbi:hypothetical protein Tel_09890 [Candidatus Tenderia electrophaga]|jgi:glycerol kinase|uniref:Glycerol kinase n=1 Tax=Candidatus Tenderia electrophaga TaxID=1748243 RepID=A0A0S2TE70_9GAMM|nr:hypothetical protein Tel_09890 [Candidatus Tenderia electrophaga]